MDAPGKCVRCGKPIPEEEHRRKFCSDACADSAGRERMKTRKALLGSMPKARLLYRYYDYRS